MIGLASFITCVNDIHSFMSLKASSTKPKKHKAMADSDWRKFASTGAWPAGEGNRPAPRQKKWSELYQRVSALHSIFYCLLFTLVIFLLMIENTIKPLS